MGDRGCEVCLMEGHEKYDTAYLDKTMTKNQIIDELKIDNYKWYKHVNNHVKPLLLSNVNELAPELAKDYVDKFGDLLQLLEREKEKAQAITDIIDSSSDPRMINAWVGVNGEIRKTIETIAKLQGDIATHSQVTNNTVNVEYKNVVEHIMQETCIACKTKLAKSLPDIIKKII